MAFLDIGEGLDECHIWSREFQEIKIYITEC